MFPSSPPRALIEGQDYLPALRRRSRQLSTANGLVSAYRFNDAFQASRSGESPLGRGARIRDEIGCGHSRATLVLLLIAASPREFAGITPRTRLASTEVRWLASAKLAGAEAVLAANGIGRAAAGGATRRLLTSRQVGAVISTGYAGALGTDLRVGDIFVARRVESAEGTFRCRLPVGISSESRIGTLRTVDRIVVSASEKREFGAHGAQAVDMEAAEVARVAFEASLPFYCLRVISDSAERDLPVDFNAALQADGTLSVPTVLRLASKTRGGWSGLLRLRRDTSRAAQSLGRCLNRCEFPT